MRFLLVSVSGSVKPHPVEIRSLEELLSFICHEGEDNDVIISRRSLVSMSHDKIQDKSDCSHVVCLYDDFIEPKQNVWKPKSN